MGDESNGGSIVDVGTEKFCGSKEPVNLRQFVHWHVPFCVFSHWSRPLGGVK